MSYRSAGFTLVEMLVTFVIIATLTALGFAGVRCARTKARTVVEVSAARNLIAAYLGNAADHGGVVMAGYKPQPGVTNLDGEELYEPMNARYPWWLVPDIPKIEGVLLFNGTESALKAPNRDYLVSVHPNMGLNAALVGGHFGSGSPLNPTPRIVSTYGKFYLDRLAEADDPGKLIVFASARSGPGEPGYFEVRSPNLTGRVWSKGKFSEDAQALDFGYVDFRWNGKAAVAMLGGSVELLGEAELRDMRRWSNQASMAKDPDFVISAQ